MFRSSRTCSRSHSHSNSKRLCSQTTATISNTSWTELDTSATFIIPPFLDDGKDDDSQSGSHTNSAYPSVLHGIHVKPILSDAETALCYQLAHAHAETTGCWERPDRERHSAYATCDFAVEECDALTHYLDQEIGFRDRVWGHLSRLYGVDPDDMTYIDLFCAHYQASASPDGIQDASTTKTMDRLEAHRDGSLLSFTVTLSPPDDFQGGGTFFEALRDVRHTEKGSSPGILQPGGVVRPLRAGDAVLHSGKVLHGASVVTGGNRTVLVGFVDVAEWCTRPGVLAMACRDWGRMDVASYRHNRQTRMTGNGDHSGWFLKTTRWLPRCDTHRSYVCGFCPAFDSVERRADPEFQRLEKLKAEDRLLRTILLTEDENKCVDKFDVSIL